MAKTLYVGSQPLYINGATRLNPGSKIPTDALTKEEREMFLKLEVITETAPGKAEEAETDGSDAPVEVKPVVTEAEEAAKQ
jgi:hypothetical protein